MKKVIKMMNNALENQKKIQKKQTKKGQRKRMSTKKWRSFAEYEELQTLVDAETARRVLLVMELLERRWERPLCRAVVKYVKTGERKEFNDSRLLTNLLSKIIRILED